MTNAPYKFAGQPDVARVNAIVSANRGMPLPVLEGEPVTERYLQTVAAVNNVVVIPPAMPEQVAQENID
jgi:hypothetical protein